jgi:hypothetical protein
MTPMRAISDLELLDRLESLLSTGNLNDICAIHVIEILESAKLNLQFGNRDHQTVCNTIEGRILSKLRSADFMARLGSAFTVLQSDISNPTDVTCFQRTLIHACQSPIVVGAAEIEFEFKIAMIPMTTNGANPVKLVAKARAGLTHCGILQDLRDFAETTGTIPAIRPIW